MRRDYSTVLWSTLFACFILSCVVKAELTHVVKNNDNVDSKIVGRGGYSSPSSQYTPQVTEAQIQKYVEPAQSYPPKCIYYEKVKKCCQYTYVSGD
jgi:hypothetical protein